MTMLSIYIFEIRKAQISTLTLSQSLNPKAFDKVLQMITAAKTLQRLSVCFALHLNQKAQTFVEYFCSGPEISLPVLH